MISAYPELHYEHASTIYELLKRNEGGLTGYRSDEAAVEWAKRHLLPLKEVKPLRAPLGVAHAVPCNGTKNPNHTE